MTMGALNCNLTDSGPDIIHLSCIESSFEHQNQHISLLLLVILLVKFNSDGTRTHDQCIWCIYEYVSIYICQELKLSCFFVMYAKLCRWHITWNDRKNLHINLDILHFVLGTWPNISLWCWHACRLVSTYNGKLVCYFISGNRKPWSKCKCKWYLIKHLIYTL